MKSTGDNDAVLNTGFTKWSECLAEPVNKANTKI